MRRIDAPLSEYTRFGLGGPANLLVDCLTPDEFAREWHSVVGEKILLGGGTNIIASDEGYRGTVLRYLANGIRRDGNILEADSGGDLEAVVDYGIAAGLGGLESMKRIPGWVSGAIYGNAGAYGQSVQQVVEAVEIFDGHAVGNAVRWLTNAECGFGYRTSLFKQHREWLILTARFRLHPADKATLAARAEEIRAVRDAKFPVTMKCAGSIFKNCFLACLPAAVQERIPPALVREGKVPSAFFLEAVGSKGMSRGQVKVADYHANLIYNAGGAAADDVVWIIDELSRRVAGEFGFRLEAEVQFVGFSDRKSY